MFLLQSALSININSPIRELLVLINQSFTSFTNFLTELKKKIGIMTWNKIKKLLSQIMKRSSFIFEKKLRFYWRRNPSNKLVTVEEELDGLDIDGIGNVVDLPRRKYIDEECGNLKVVVDGG